MCDVACDSLLRGSLCAGNWTRLTPNRGPVAAGGFWWCVSADRHRRSAKRRRPGMAASEASPCGDIVSFTSLKDDELARIAGFLHGIEVRRMRGDVTSSQG